ncbi:MAG TPA: hypothetical protein VLT84_09760 [Acidobacteriota bacterium]|nr:hypothetical protein [Acidobacteriota bacterium]
MNDEPGGLEGDALAGIVGEEALRTLAQAEIRPDPERIAAGWERRFVVEARRADEYANLYEAIGYEVAADPVRREQVTEECDGCRVALWLEFRTIYTRKRTP